jgi:phosphoglycolate phosphatase
MTSSGGHEGARARLARLGCAVPIRAILFDKDGTLVDFQRTWGPATHAVIAHFANGDQAIYDRLALVSGFIAAERCFLAGSPLVAGATPEYGSLWAQVLDRPATAELFAELDRLFFVAGLEHLTPIGEPSAVLGVLRRRGHRLGIITNDAEANARAQAARLGIDDLLDFIAGYDSGFGAKPDAGPVLAFARTVGAEPRELAVVGDAVHDLLAARTAGAVAIAVRTGPTPSDLLAPHADVVLDSIADLPAWLAE